MANIADRIFQGENNYRKENEWFYRAREGIGGPYCSPEDAILALTNFIDFCKEHGFTGGRNDD